MYMLVDIRTGLVYAKGSTVYWLLRDLQKMRDRIYRASWRPPYYDALMHALLSPFVCEPQSWADLKAIVSPITSSVKIVKVL